MFGYNQDNSQQLHFFVSDTGIGIPEYSFEFIYKRFWRSAEYLNEDPGGTGLGLAICKSLIERLGGTIWCNSKFNEGTTFHFTMPYKDKKKEKQTSATAPKNEVPSYNWEGKTIFIIEDDMTSMLLLEEVLIDTNASVIKAETGTEALQTFKNNQKQIDLIIMDIQLPEKDGIELTQEIREIDNDVPIIAQTAYAMKSDKDRFIEVGCNDYIAKPINTKRLLELINSYITLV